MARARIILFLFSAYAQGNALGVLPLTFSWGHHSASALPVYGALSHSLNPSLRVGTEWGYGKSRSWEDRPWALLQGLDVAVFRNPFHGTGAITGTQGILRGNTRWGVFFGISLEAGYLHVFHPRETFTANGDGTFSRSSSWGRSSVLFGPGLHLGYRSFRLGSMRLYPRWDYSCRIQYPYNDLIPIFPHNLFQLGFTLDMDKGAGGGKDA